MPKEIASQIAPVAERLAVVPAVRAVAVVGSYASGASGDDSDVDLYIYLDRQQPARCAPTVGDKRPRGRLLCRDLQGRVRQRPAG